jgi:6,7-dimethyl-8-ribityllumazine synthase
MVKTIEGKLKGDGRKFGIVLSRFNSFIGERLLEGCLDALTRHGVKDSDITLVRVPGSFEIPLQAKMLAKTKKFDAVICLGALIRGETPHFDYIAAETTKGIAQASLETEVPISFGVITADSIEQAISRAGAKSGNKGWEAALAALEMADLFAQTSKK